jgi:hypothetical protein
VRPLPGMTAHARVISGFRREVSILWLGAVAVGAALVLRSDLSGEGLRGTLLFKSIGYSVYPVFYGCIAILIFRFGRLLANGGDYLSASDSSIVVGGRVLPLDGLSVDVTRNWLGLREIVFLRNSQREFAVKAYALSKPVAER